MIVIDSNRHIHVTRGDCAPFTITLTGEDVPEDGTEILFTVKKTSGHPTPVIEKTIELADGQITVLIQNEDTKELPFGDYEWDIRIPDMYGENEPYTPMKPAKFSVERVIGNV